MSKRRLIVPIFLILALLSFVPSKAAWGAGWGSGSVNGYSTGTVPYANGTSVNALVAPPGCKGHGEHDDHDHDKDDKDDCSHETRSGSPIRTSVVSNNASDPTVLTGAVFCKRTNKSEHDDHDSDDNKIRRGTMLATVKISVPAASNVQNGQFAVHISVPQSVLNTLDAKTLCTKSDDKEKEKATWQIIDFVPREFFARLKVGPETRTFNCVMNPADFAALNWDKHAGHPANKPYQC